MQKQHSAYVCTAWLRRFFVPKKEKAHRTHTVCGGFFGLWGTAQTVRGQGRQCAFSPIHIRHFRHRNGHRHHIDYIREFYGQLRSAVVVSLLVVLLVGVNLERSVNLLAEYRAHKLMRKGKFRKAEV